MKYIFLFERENIFSFILNIPKYISKCFSGTKKIQFQSFLFLFKCYARVIDNESYVFSWIENIEGKKYVKITFKNIFKF